MESQFCIMQMNERWRVKLKKNEINYKRYYYPFSKKKIETYFELTLMFHELSREIIRDAGPCCS